MVARFIFRRLKSRKQEVCEKSDKPSDDTLQDYNIQCPFASQFATYGSDGCDTRRVEQTEDQEDEGKGGRHDLIQSSITGEEDSDGAHNTFLGHEARDECSHPSPVSQTERCKERGYGTSNVGQHAFGLIDHRHMPVEVAEEPDDERC